MNKTFKKIFLIVLDGFGLASPGPGNGVLNANMQFLNAMIAKYPALSLVASGLVVGLPSGTPGNSEVGHSAIGTGRIVMQDLARINLAIQDKSFFTNRAFLGAMENCKRKNSSLHIIGSLSRGGIHSHEDHLFALLELFGKKNCKHIFVHLITDGEDAPPTASLESLTRLEPYLKKSGARIASISGRMFGMDRVNNWDLTQKAWDVMVTGKGPTTDNVRTYIQSFHDKGVFDEGIEPAVVTEGGTTDGQISSNDSVIFFNYRNDRMRQMVTPFVVENFNEFERGARLEGLFTVSMTQYSAHWQTSSVAFESHDVGNTLGEVISAFDLRQVRIAEQEKAAHVTNFFNGGIQGELPRSEHVILPSQPLTQTEVAEHPEMAAPTITKTVLERKDDGTTLTVINFANADMVAHSGNPDAVSKGLSILDTSLKEIIETITANPDYAIVITADHGNAEMLLDPITGKPDTQHTAHYVPIVFIGQGLELPQAANASLETLASETPLGSLIDVAPSILKLLGLEKPADMTGQSLI